jgi:hypothetical protein
VKAVRSKGGRAFWWWGEENRLVLSAVEKEGEYRKTQ